MKAGRTHMCDMYQMTQFVSPSPSSFFEESIKVVFKHLTQPGASKCNIISCLMSLWVSRLPAEHRNTAWITAHLVPTEMFSFFFSSFSPMQMKGKSNFQSQNKVAHWGINLTELSWVIRSVIGSDSAIISLTVCLNKHINTLASVNGAGIPPGGVCSDVICANVELIL